MLLYVRSSGSETSGLELIRKVSEEGDLVYRCEPRGFGATQWTRKNPPNYVERSHTLLGRTVDSGRVYDIASVARYLRRRHGEGIGIHVLGEQSGGILAAYAALFEPGIAGVIVKDIPLTHMDLSSPPILNVLRVCDIPDILGLLAPRPLRVIGDLDHRIQKTQAIYSAAQADTSLSLADGFSGRWPVPGLNTLIDLSDSKDVHQRVPVLIAHRGGIVNAQAPECSSEAIRLAAEAGLTMVELDVQESRDGVPILFHDRNMSKACGIDGSVNDYEAAFLKRTSFKGSPLLILTLEDALALCRQYRLGVMLDLKSGRDDARFLKEIDRVIVEHGLGHATISISSSLQARQQLKHVLFRPTDKQMIQFREGNDVDLKGTFWFGLPAQVTSSQVVRLKQNGAYVFPAINTFRYDEGNHMESAAKDIERLRAAGVDGFQIDSVYLNLLP